MNRRHFVLGVLVAPVLLDPGALVASDFGGGRPEERYFGVEAALADGRRGRVVEGYVNNRYDASFLRVRLTIQPLDGAQRPLGDPITAHVGEIPARHRTFFRAAVPAEAAAVRASVTYFEFAPRGGGGGGG